MDDDVESNGEPDLLDRLWKYAIGLCVVLVVLAHPTSRFQAFLNMSIWSVLVLGFITLYVWPFLADALAISVLALIFVFHFAVMWGLYPRVPHHGYIAIWFAGFVEIAVCWLPIIWLDVRSKRRTRGRSSIGGRPESRS
jgi:hypothetical protein